jgi:hypothetical protein
VTPTWIVWSPTPPEAREKISCVSPLDAARAWADRQFRKGWVARPGTDVLVRSESDPDIIRPPGMTSGPPMAATTYQVRLTIVNAPAFRASMVGLAFEGGSMPDPGPGPDNGARHG